MERPDSRLFPKQSGLYLKSPTPTSTPHFVVIGIDFGTTYSGVSWTWSKADRPDQINTVHRWEVGAGGGRDSQADKVPSKISYDRRGHVLKWGYMVTPRDEFQAKWFKLLLSQDARSQGGERVEETNEVLRRLGKTPTDVVADYLRCLWKHAVEDIELSLGKISVDQMTFRVVLTVPANWDHKAQAETKRAAHRAGIDAARNRGPTIFRMVSEPEAAALAAWKEAGLRWSPNLKIGDTFVVCDAGGGTVDLISYRVDSWDPLRLSMCVEATGDLCGAVYLDDAFDSAMRTIVGDSVYDRLDCDVKAKVFENDWEWGPKRKYIGPASGPQEFAVDIPGYKPKKTGLLGLGKRPSSTIVLKNGHLSSIFQPVVNKIVDLVSTQVNAVIGKTSVAPKAVLLVGGFGDNGYVLNQLRDTFSRTSSVQRPVNAWAAISRGAVFKGLSTTPETDTVTNFITKLNYGIRYDDYFKRGLHDEQDRYKCKYRNIDMARNQFRWYVRRGESISKLKPVEYIWIRQLERPSQLDNLHDTIWVSDLQEPPTRMCSDVKELCKIKCSFEPSVFWDLEERKSHDGKIDYRELKYTLDMKVAAGELEWAINYRDQQKGTAKVHVEYIGIGDV